MKLEYIKSKNIEDYKKLIDELFADFGEHFAQSISYYCDDDYDKSNYWQIYLVKYDDDIIGICGLYTINDITSEMWLGWFGIIPEMRNKKIGSIIIDYLKETAKNLGDSKIKSYVDSNGKPLNFYYRNNFKLFGTVREYAKKYNISLDHFEDVNDFVIECDI